MQFDYAEDREFFEQLLDDCGGIAQQSELFDFRDPREKRREFGRIRHEVFAELIARLGSRCELACHPDCAGMAEEVDHLVPLASNALNKELRGMKSHGGKKVPAQSFGSNNLKNLVLACKRCNAYKKHRLPEPEQLLRILGAHGRRGF